MSTIPRTRGCRFSSVRSSGRPSKLGASIPRKAVNAGSIAIVRSSIPAASHSAWASVFDPSDEYRLGMDTAWTCSGPMASAAMTPTRDESMPPDSAKTTSVKPFFTT